MTFILSSEVKKVYFKCGKATNEIFFASHNKINVIFIPKT